MAVVGLRKGGQLKKTCMKQYLGLFRREVVLRNRSRAQNSSERQETLMKSKQRTAKIVSQNLLMSNAAQALGTCGQNIAVFCENEMIPSVLSLIISHLRIPHLNTSLHKSSLVFTSKTRRDISHVAAGDITPRLSDSVTLNTRTFQKRFLTLQRRPSAKNEFHPWRSSTKNYREENQWKLLYVRVPRKTAKPVNPNLPNFAVIETFIYL